MSTTRMIQSNNDQQVQANHPNQQSRPIHQNQHNRQARPVHPNHQNQHNRQARPVQTNRQVHPVHYNEQCHNGQPEQPNHHNNHVQSVRYLQPVQSVRYLQPVQPVQLVQTIQPVQLVQTIQPVQTINQAFFDKIANSASTSFGRACVLFTAELLKQVLKAVSKDPKSICYHVFLRKYDENFQIDAKPQDVVVTSGFVKFQIHELLYGPLLNLDGKADFCTRFDDPKLWKNQWGFNFSPFRVVQKLLKDNGLYLVDHTYNGNIPFIYLYRQLPARDVVKNKPWHNNYSIPELNKKDFAGNLLPHNEANSAVQGACDKFVAMYMAGEVF